ncbi:MAG: hypothetical protein AAF975_01400 [Spirochaetota bacterium]
MASRTFWPNDHVAYNQPFPAYIVHSEPWRDLHRHVIFLSPRYGLLSAFLYGAVSKRNPLRATAQSFSFGQLSLKPGKQIQIADWHLEAPSLVLHTPSCVETYRHAGLWSELLLYSHGSGPAQLFAELRSLLSSVLHFDSKDHCHLASLRFLWQFLLREGFRPGLSRCHHCDHSFQLLSESLFFSRGSELFCRRCARSREGHYLNRDELNLLCWAEQDLADFVRQDEFFFGIRSGHYALIAAQMLGLLQDHLELLLGRKLYSRDI